MITVIRAEIKQGYSGEDHLNTSIQEYAGMQFSSVGRAKQIIYTKSVRSGANATRSPIFLEVQFANGRTWMG